MTPIKKSLAITNSSFFFLLLIYFLNVVFDRMIYLKLGIPAIVFIIPLKILAYGGLLGSLVELVSGEEIVFNFGRFRANAATYWKHYLATVGFPFLIHFILSIKNFIGIELNVFSFFAFINPLLLFILAKVIIENKYARLLGPERKRMVLTLPIVAALLGLFILTLFIFHLPYILQTADFELSRITGFLHLYLNMLIFTYFSALLLKEYPGVQQVFDIEKEIFLINPLGGGIAFYLSSLFLRMYPPVFVVIKALTPKRYKFREFNRTVWKKHYYKPNKLVAITCFTSNCLDAYRIAREFKERGSKVILGGPHVTYFPDEALEYCDSVVCGESESIWPQVIRDYENDNMQKKYMGVPVNNCHELVYQELLHSPPEIIKDFLETSRGCKFKCHFCTVPSLSQGSLRKQNVVKFVELVKKVRTKYRHVTFIDNNIYSDPAYTKELCLALKPLKIRWATQCTIDIAKNTKLLKLAKDSGCSFFLMGFEISESSLEKSRGGKLALADHFKEYARKVKNLGILIKAHYIFGFESDTFRHLCRFWKFCFVINPYATVLSILTPYPGSQFYYDMIAQDRISNLNWRHYGGQTLVFDHPRMNSLILARVFPIIFVFFLFTTSKLGYFLLFLAILTVVII